MDGSDPSLGARCAELFGGQRLQALIARAPAQHTPFLMLDESASRLDDGNPLRLLDWLDQLREECRGLLFTAHHPGHAFPVTTAPTWAARSQLPGQATGCR